jgi:uncharacterized membrane protein
VKLFSWLKKKPFFTEEENRRIVEAIRDAEQKTSGEVRVFLEPHCKFMDAMDRAVEIFHVLKMDQTKDRNATLVYVAYKDHQLAVLGDEGIHQKVGDRYWYDEVKKMISAFNRENIAEGIRQCVLDIGQALHTHFPYNKDTDKNELPDDIIFGR